MHSWHNIFTTNNYPEASIIQGLLEENSIPVQMLNKMDSSYQTFGEIELFVPIHLKEMALDLISKALMN